jgi:hypothetical protein
MYENRIGGVMLNMFTVSVVDEQPQASQTKDYKIGIVFVASPLST